MDRVSLTKQFIQRVSCPENKKKQRIYDKKVRNLFLQVRASGAKAYYVKYQDARGRYIEMKIADAADISPAQARSRAEEIRAQVALGRDPLAEKTEYKQILKFKEFAIEQYLPFVKNYKRSWELDEGLLRIHICPVIGQKYLDEVTRDDVVGIQNKKVADGIAPATANRMVKLLRYMFNLAIKWQAAGVQSNPAKGVPMLVENNEIGRYLSTEEISRLYEAVTKSSNPLLAPIISLLILTGARKSEVLNARWEDFDLSRKRWRIPLSKSGKARHVPLSDGAIKILDGVPRLEGSVYVFPNPDTGEPFTSVYRSWFTARRNAGLDDVRIHDLRHSFASFLVNSGRSLYEVQKLLGHTQIKTTQRYAHLSQETLLEATNAVSESLSIIGQPMAS